MSKLLDSVSPTARSSEKLFRRVILKALCDQEVVGSNNPPDQILMRVFDRLNRAFMSLHPGADSNLKEEFRQAIWVFLQDANRESGMQTLDALTTDTQQPPRDDRKFSASVPYFKPLKRKHSKVERNPNANSR